MSWPYKSHSLWILFFSWYNKRSELSITSYITPKRSDLNQIQSSLYKMIMFLKICIKILHSKTKYTKMAITAHFGWLDNEWFLFFKLQHFSIKITVIYTIRKMPNYVSGESHASCSCLQKPRDDYNSDTLSRNFCNLLTLEWVWISQLYHHWPSSLYLSHRVMEFNIESLKLEAKQK